MAIKVTPDQVDDAKLLMALDRADGRTSAEWIVRLANAKPAGVWPVGDVAEAPTAVPPRWFRRWRRNHPR